MKSDKASGADSDGSESSSSSTAVKEGATAARNTDEGVVEDHESPSSDVERKSEESKHPTGDAEKVLKENIGNRVSLSKSNSSSSHSPPIRVTFARYPRRTRMQARTAVVIPSKITGKSQRSSARKTDSSEDDSEENSDDSEEEEEGEDGEDVEDVEDVEDDDDNNNSNNNNNNDNDDDDDDDDDENDDNREFIRVRKIHLPGARRSTRISIKTRRMYGKRNNTASRVQSKQNSGEASDHSDADSTRYSPSAASEESNDDRGGADRTSGRKGLGRASFRRRRQKRAPARMKKQLPPRPPSPVKELTEQERQERLEQLVKQSAEISKELHVAISRSRPSPGQALDANNSTSDSTNEKADGASSNSTVKDQPGFSVSIAEGFELQPHQREGVDWLLKLDESGYNGILADEMGLGKTIQCLAFLAEIVANGKRGPHLVIAPLAVVNHWAIEAETWFPGMMKVFVHMGSGSSRLETLSDALLDDDFDIIVTSYELAMRDLFGTFGRPPSYSMLAQHRRAIRQLRQLEFEYLIVDEAHRLKNPKSKLTQALRRYNRASRRLLLTGTPLSNHLLELWALLNVLNPQIFGNVSTFKGWFQSPFDDDVQLTNTEKSIIVARMHTVLRPFFRRRLRSDVCPEFSSSDEVLVNCPATPLQNALKNFFMELKRKPGLDTFPNIVMKLRKAANCTWAVSDALYDDQDLRQVNALGSSSGKLMFLHYALPRLLAAGHRVLIFSQFTGMLSFLEDLLDGLAIAYGRLDGTTDGSERARLINDFNAPDTSLSVFLLSTRAGGVGINLQSADTVILFDSDWNPSLDLQAVSRIQRIGQTKTVHIMRLVTEKHIDELMITRARKKMRTEAVAVGAGKFTTADEGETSRRQSDIRELLDAFDVEQSLFEAQPNLRNSAGNNSRDKHDATVENPSVTRLATEPTVLPESAQHSGHTSAANGDAVIPSNVERVSNSEAKDGATPQCDGFPKESSSLLAMYIAEWDRNLLRAGEQQLPKLETHPALELPSWESVPKWLRSPQNPRHIIVGLRANSVAEAQHVVFKAQQEDSGDVVDTLCTRAKRKTRFGQSLAEEDVFDSFASDSDSSADSTMTKSRSKTSRSCGTAGRSLRKRRRSVDRSSGNDSDVDFNVFSESSEESGDDIEFNSSERRQMRVSTKRTRTNNSAPIADAVSTPAQLVSGGHEPSSTPQTPPHAEENKTVTEVANKRKSYHRIIDPSNVPPPCRSLAVNDSSLRAPHTEGEQIQANKERNVPINTSLAPYAEGISTAQGSRATSNGHLQPALSVLNADLTAAQYNGIVRSHQSEAGAVQNASVAPGTTGDTKLSYQAGQNRVVPIANVFRGHSPQYQGGFESRGTNAPQLQIARTILLPSCETYGVDSTVKTPVISVDSATEMPRGNVPIVGLSTGKHDVTLNATATEQTIPVLQPSGVGNGNALVTTLNSAAARRARSEIGEHFAQHPVQIVQESAGWSTADLNSNLVHRSADIECDFEIDIESALASEVSVPCSHLVASCRIRT